MKATGIIIAVLLLFALCWCGIFYFYGSPQNAGTFGDQFGAINALFSALALAGVIYTLIMQQQEMSAQRREFMNSRAYTLAYKQVELVNNSIIDARNRCDDGEYRSFAAIKNSFIRGNLENAMNILTNRNYGHLNTLRIMANSCDLLVRLKKDGMSDEDANILFNTLRYNVDKDIWSTVKKLNYLPHKDPSLYEEYEYYYEESLERINRFNDIYQSIKKDTDDIG